MRLVRNTTNGPRISITGVIDGVNKIFTASHGIVPGTEDLILVYRNGLLQHEGSSEDYTLVAFTELLKINFNIAPSNDPELEKIDIVYYAIGG